MQSRWLAVVALLLTCWGCEHDLNLTIRFDRVSGLEQTDPVIWDQNRIGTVDEVRYTAQGEYAVAVTVNERFRQAVTDRSRFLVGDAPQGNGRVLEMIQSEEGGAPVPDGAVLEGTTRTQVLAETMHRGMEEFLEDLRQIPESEAIRTLDRQLDALAEELKRSGEHLRDRIEKEILPQLERELEGLREWLRKRGREDEIDPLQEKLEELKRA